MCCRLWQVPSLEIDRTVFFGNLLQIWKHSLWGDEPDGRSSVTCLCGSSLCQHPHLRCVRARIADPASMSSPGLSIPCLSYLPCPTTAKLGLAQGICSNAQAKLWFILMEGQGSRAEAASPMAGACSLDQEHPTCGSLWLSPISPVATGRSSLINSIWVSLLTLHFPFLVLCRWGQPPAPRARVHRAPCTCALRGRNWSHPWGSEDP